MALVKHSIIPKIGEIAIHLATWQVATTPILHRGVLGVQEFTTQ